MKKLIALVLALAMVAVLGLAFADPVTTGTIVVDNATANITYKAYKIFSATLTSTESTNTGITYTVPTAKATYVDTDLFDLIANNDGGYTVTAKSGTTAAQISSWLTENDNYKNFDATGTEATYSATAGTATFSGLAFGYYYITSGLGTTVTIDSTMPNANVKDKNETTPDVDKKITAENGTAITPATTNDAAVGSTETYTVTSNVYNWVYPTSGEPAKKAEKYTFTDTPSDIDIDADTVRVTVNGTAVYENKAAVGTSGVTVGKDSNGKLTVMVPWVDGEGNFRYNAASSASGKIPIVITYDAEILSTAVSSTADNDVVLKYTHTTDQDVTVGEKETNTTTYKFQLDKAKADYTDLLGAKFELYLGSVAAANKVNLVATTDGYRKADSDDAAEDIVTEIDLTTVAKKVITGLDKADYVLVETQVPAGYNKADDQTVPSTTLVAYNGTITDNAATIVGDVGVVTVVNNQGTELPSTGGIGTTIFYIVGGLLLVGAAVILVARRKASEK